MGKGKRVRICLKKPYDAEIEYLEADNTGSTSLSKSKYITFDIEVNIDTDIWICEAQFIAYGNTAGCYGCTGNRFAFGRGSASWNDWYFGLGTANNRTGLKLDSLRHVFRLDGPARKFSIDGSSFSGSGTSVSGSYSPAFFNRSNNLDTAKSRLYSSKYYRSGVLVRDFIPVRFTNEKGQTEGALYDKVSKQIFRNKGSGSFLLGPDKRIINPPKKLFFAPRKPYDAEIEYLESTGTQWIDTEANTSPNGRIESKLQKTSNVGTNIGIWGCGGAYTGCLYSIRFPTQTNEVIIYPYASQNNISQFSILVDTTLAHDYVIDQTEKYASVDGVKSYFSSSASGTLYRIYLFAYGKLGSADPSLSFVGKCYNTRIYDNSTIIRDFIPVRFTNENGQTEGALYDKVSKQLFRNKGSGSFLLGPDKKNPEFKKPKTIYIGSKNIETTAKDYIQDGLVSMWDGIENAGWGVHDDNATIWKDLINSYELPIMSGGSWGENCIIGDGTAPAAGTNSSMDSLKQPFAEAVFSIDELPENNAIKPALYLKFSSTTGYHKDFGLANNYGTIYIYANQRLEKNPEELYLEPHTVSLASTGRSTNQAYYVNAIPRTSVGGTGVSSFNRGFFIGAATNTGIGWSFPSKTTVYNIRFYNRILTSEEIAYNYSIDKVRFNLP